MKTAGIFWWRYHVLALAVGIGVVAATWNYSAREPVFHAPGSRWVPICFTPDGEILAAAMATPQDGLEPPGGPIHLLRATDLTSTGPPIETPAGEMDQRKYHPPLETVEFSPHGDLLAVLQRDRKARLDLLELHLIRLPEGEVWKSFSIPYDRWHKRGGIADRLFCNNGGLLAWHELAERRHMVRVWDVAESRERFAVDGVTYPVLSPDGSLLAAVEPYNGGGISCRLYDARDGQLVRSLVLDGDDAGWQPWPKFSPDGRLLAVNCRSSTGKGPAVRVFEVASGKSVLDAAEWSPHFVAGPTLVTVKDDSVLFRSTQTWQVVAQAKFSLGLHWDSGSPISPEPAPLPGPPAAIVYDYYPTGDGLLPRLGRFLHLRHDGGHRANWIDATSGQVTRFTAAEGLMMRMVVSPDGRRLAVQGSSGLAIWELPPQRSWVPAATVLGLFVVLWGAWLLVRRGRVARAREASDLPS
jgi:WD40 repeat protein